MSERPAESGPEAEAPAADAARAFRKEHLKLELKGLRVADGLAMLQIIRRWVKAGAVEDASTKNYPAPIVVEMF